MRIINKLKLKKLVVRYLSLTVSMSATLFVLFLLSPSVNASPWLQETGSSMLSTSVSYQQAKKSWDKDGKLISEDCKNSARMLYPHYEYGLSYRYTFFGGIGYTQKKCGVDDVAGVGDLSVGIRGRMNPYRNGRAWELALTLPTSGDDDLGRDTAGLRTGIYYEFRDEPYENFLNKQLRPSYWELGSDLSTWFNDTPHRWRLYGGWNKRVSQVFKVRFRLTGRLGFDGDSTKSDKLIFNLNRDRYRLIEATIQTKYKLSQNNGLGVKLSQGVWGRSIARDSSFSINYSFHW